ncbi:MAG: hypothetical protein IPL75_11115 [Acidobacteria bacterium]|nr:hypothetical protein [Acidobacteriota bacterium]
MTAWLFRLHRLETGRHMAWAVVCVEARYCSLALPGVPSLVRRLLTARDWKAVVAELGMGLNAGPLPASGPIANALAGEGGVSVIVRYAMAVQVDAPPFEVARALDARLLGQPHP